MEHTISMFWRVVAGCAVLALLSLAGPSCVYACSCLPPGPPADELAASTAVFSGKVTGVVLGPAGLPGANQVTFAVERSWKGGAQPTVVVNTPTSSASCGVDFTVDQSYLVYATESEGALQTNLCSRTTQLDNAGDDLAALGQGTVVSGTPTTLPPTGDDAGGSAQLPLVTAAALALIALGAAVASRRLSAGVAPARARAGRWRIFRNH